MLFNGLVDKIKKIDDDWLECTKVYMKIKFTSDDNLPLNKPLKFYQMTIEENMLHPQVFLDGALYSL